MKTDNLYWRCFLALEGDLIETFNYVEFDQNNFETYSIKFRSIILQSCSDIEVLLKKICKLPEDKNSNIKIYRDYILEHHLDFSRILVSAPRFHLDIRPWEKFQEEESPLFWDAYSKIKHAGGLKMATLKNAVDSLAGLFALLLAWHVICAGKSFSNNTNISEPNLFDYKGLCSTSLALLSSNCVTIPGFN